IATVTLNVLDHFPPRDRRQPYKVRCSDDTATIELVFFHAHADYLQNTLPLGEKRIVSGRIDKFKDKLQMAHPDFIFAPGQEKDLPQHEAVYALTEGLPAKSLSKAIRAALEKVPTMPEWQDAAFQKTRAWAPFGEALSAAHNPAHEADLSSTHTARERLA